MDRNLSDIKISTDFFGQSVCLNDILSRPINIVYGKNGSGKSTIAGEIRKYASSGNADVNIEFNDNIDVDKEKIYVFNEAFIRDNVEFAQNGKLSTIVMLGGAVSLSKQIDDVSNQITDIETRINELDLKIEETKNNRQEEIDKLNRELKDDYAARIRDIRGLTRKSPVNVADIFPVKTEALKHKSATLLKDISDGIERLKEIRAANNVKIEWNCPEIDVDAICNEAASLVSETIERPILSDREKYIVGLLGKYNVLQLSKDLIINSDAECCPLCHQTVSDNLKKDLESTVKNIESVLQDKAGDFKVRIQVLMEKCINFPEIDFSPIGNRFYRESQNVKDHYSKLKECFRWVYDRLSQRRDNLFDNPANLDTSALYYAYNNFIDARNKLDNAIKDYNDDIDKYDDLKNTLLEKNTYLAYLEHKSDIEICENYEKEIDSCKSEISNNTKELGKIKKKESDLRNQMDKIEIALDYLNYFLSCIFMSNDRLQLDVDRTTNQSGTYILKSNGREIHSDKLSIGERNAIALSYFFVNTYRGRAVNEIYRDDALYVFDDPISSLDANNRIGVLSLLKDQFNRIRMGNMSSKVMILSHDLQTVYELASFIDRNNTDYSFLELRDKALHKVKYVYRNQYQRLINKIYCYALHNKGPVSDEYSTIGNEIRIMIESYSSFSYSLGPEDMLSDPRILSSVPQEYRDFYSTCAYMLALNLSSHSFLRVDSTNPLSPISYDDTTFVKIARLLLLFILFTNRTHLELMLKNPDVQMVENWKYNISAMTESMMSCDQMLRNLIDEHEGKEFKVERSGDVLYCGRCMITSNYSITGKIVKLHDVKCNSNRNTSSEFPLYGKYTIQS